MELCQWLGCLFFSYVCSLLLQITFRFTAPSCRFYQSLKEWHFASYRFFLIPNKVFNYQRIMGEAKQMINSGRRLQIIVLMLPFWSLYRFQTCIYTTLSSCWQMPFIRSWRTGSGTAWPASPASGRTLNPGKEDDQCWKPSRRYFFLCISSSLISKILTLGSISSWGAYYSNQYKQYRFHIFTVPEWKHSLFGLGCFLVDCVFSVS